MLNFSCFSVFFIFSVVLVVVGLKFIVRFIGLVMLCRVRLLLVVMVLLL